MKISGKSILQRTGARASCATVILIPLLAWAGEDYQRHAHAAHQHMTPTEAKSGDYTLSVRSYTIPEVTLIDSHAQPVRLREALAAEGPVMVNFIFTSCTAICPVMSRIFSQVPGKLGAEAGRLRMISISIDPENDTPQELEAYAKNFSVNPRWQFLTGSVENIQVVQRAFDNYRGDKMNHEPLTFLRPAPEKAWVRIDGFASAAELVQEYQKVVLK